MERFSNFVLYFISCTVPQFNENWLQTISQLGVLYCTVPWINGCWLLISVSWIKCYVLYYTVLFLGSMDTGLRYQSAGCTVLYCTMDQWIQVVYIRKLSVLYFTVLYQSSMDTDYMCEMCVSQCTVIYCTVLYLVSMDTDCISVSWVFFAMSWFNGYR